MTMDMRVHYAFLPHTDPEASIAFYADLLGFEVRNRVDYSGMSWITLGSPHQPDVSLVLEPPGADPGLSDDERRTITELMAKGSFGRMTLATPNLDSDFERLEAAGVEIVQEPMDQPYGVRDCAVRDPAGNLLRINQL